MILMPAHTYSFLSLSDGSEGRDELLANALKLYTDSNTGQVPGQRDVTQLSYDTYTKTLVNYVPIYLGITQQIYNALNFRDAASKRRTAALVSGPDFSRQMRICQPR